MDLAWISLAALLIVVVMSCTSRVHPGFLALALAWIVGVYFRPEIPQREALQQVIAGFPRDLFLTLAGVSLLFTQAQMNGTLDRLAHAAVRLCRGNVGLIPWMFFLLAAFFAMVGAGNIAAAALVAPMAMNLAAKAKIPATLMTVMVGHGSLAGALSSISPTGIIAQQQMERFDLGGHALEIFVYNLLANLAAATLGFFVFGGRKLFSSWYEPGKNGAETDKSDDRFEPRHWATLGILAVLLGGVLVFKIHVGMGAFAAAVVLALTGLADDTAAVRKMPWSVIMMVCGVNVLTALLERTGGIDKFADIIVAVSNPLTAPAVIGLVAALVSVYSSTSGVVLPAFLPMVQNVVTKLGGGDPLALSASVIVAGHLVDVSPLSTIGAPCVAGSSVEEDRQAVFTKILFWGLAMAFVGAGLCFLFFGLWW